MIGSTASRVKFRNLDAGSLILKTAGEWKQRRRKDAKENKLNGKRPWNWTKPQVSENRPVYFCISFISPSLLRVFVVQLRFSR